MLLLKKIKNQFSYECGKFFDDLTPDAEKFIIETEANDFKDIKLPNVDKNKLNSDLNTKSSTLRFYKSFNADKGLQS